MSTKSLTITVPRDLGLSKLWLALHNFFQAVSETGERYLGVVYSKFVDLISSRRASRQGSAISSSGRLPKLPPRLKKYIKPIVTTLLVITVAGVIVRIIYRPSSGITTNSRVMIQGARNSQEIKREFKFPIKDNAGETVSEIKYTVESAELRDEIIVKGQKATAVKGRVFLVFNLRIKNEYRQPIEINTKDYVRLSVNGNRDEWLAPDIHNDPVEVQAISTELTRVGFAINENDRELVIRVGEINGEKQEIAVNFK